MNEEIQQIAQSYNPPLDEWTAKVVFGMRLAVEREVAELRRLKLPIIVSQNGQPFDCNPDTNPNAPTWNN
jgi:hypothetical protein